MKWVYRSEIWLPAVRWHDERTTSPVLPFTALSLCPILPAANLPYRWSNGKCPIKSVFIREVDEFNNGSVAAGLPNAQRITFTNACNEFCVIGTSFGERTESKGKEQGERIVTNDRPYNVDTTGQG